MVGYGAFVDELFFNFSAMTLLGLLGELFQLGLRLRHSLVVIGGVGTATAVAACAESLGYETIGVKATARSRCRRNSMAFPRSY